MCTCVDRISQDPVLNLPMNCSLPGIVVLLLTIGARRLTGRGPAPLRNVTRYQEKLTFLDRVV